MPRPSIDFLNARRALMPAGTGGKIRSDRLRTAFNSLDNLDQAAVLIDREFADFRSWFRERRWKAPLKASKPQIPCDHGPFSDEASQLDMVEMFQDPTNEE